VKLQEATVMLSEWPRSFGLSVKLQEATVMLSE